MTPSIIDLIRKQFPVDDARARKMFPVLNPADGQVLAHVPDREPEDAQQAIEAAHQAFGIWKKCLASERSTILRRWYDLIIDNLDELAEILTREQGKPLDEARAEIRNGALGLEFSAEEAKRIAGEVLTPFRSDARALVLRQPLGVIAAITPWNFPSGMILRKVSVALAAGCTVVCKPAEETPLSAVALAVLAERAGVPPGVLNIITTSQPAAVGAVLATHPLVRGVAFTGSTEVGRLLMKQASSTIKKVLLELGGNAPFIVFDDADIQEAARGLISSKFRNSGQTCISANRIFVHEAIYDAFVAAFVPEVRKLRLGNGLEPGVTQGPLINHAALRKVEEHVADAVGKGAKVAIGGKVSALGGTYFEPTVLVDVPLDALLMSEETFGPVAALTRFRDEQDVIAHANDTHQGLSAYFYTRDMKRIWRVSEALESGMVGINTGAITSAYIPFGGVKQSGLGREGSHHGIEEYTELKYVLMGSIDT